MEARHEARKAQLRDETRLAWQIANFGGVAFAGKLKDLKHYLKHNDETESKSNGSEALLGALLRLKRKGVPMTIERLH